MSRTSALGGEAHELADPIDIERDKWVVLEDPEPLIGPSKARGVIARQAKNGLSQVVCAKAEKFGGLSDLAGAQRRPRQLDHGADEIAHRNAGACHHLLADAIDDRLENVKLLLGRH